MKKIIFIIYIAIIAISCTKKATIIVKNNSNLYRSYTSIEIPYIKIDSSLTKESASGLAIFENNKEIPSQLLDSSILFQVIIKPRHFKEYIVKTVRKRDDYPIQAYGRFVSERFDDWSWENNCIAYRVYGPALEKEKMYYPGIDVWLKRTEDMIINKWYTPGYNYHKDSGEGLDCYDVGRTLGAGAMAPIVNDNFVLGGSYSKYKILEEGPLRISVKLTYPPIIVNGEDVVETRIITLDANTYLNKITSKFSGNFDVMKVGAGIVLRKAGETQFYVNAITYSEPINGENGVTHLGVVMNGNLEGKIINNHFSLIKEVRSGEDIVYYAGAGWSKFGFENNNMWNEYIVNVMESLYEPLDITVKK